MNDGVASTKLWFCHNIFLTFFF